MIDIWEWVRRVPPIQLAVLCVALATVLAVGISHVFWYWYTGAVPDGLTVVAGGAAVVVSVPLVQIFVVGVYRLQRSSDRLFHTKTKLSFKNEELHKARIALSRMNEELEQRVAERTAELERALAIAETANESKSMFLANMSHELRTPLNGIIGYAEMIVNRQMLFSDGMSTETLDEYAAAIQSSGQHLNELVGDLLDLSKIEFEQFDIHPAPTQVDTLVGQVVTELEPAAHARNQTIDLQVPAGEITFETDPRAARQILTNLLSNALKYSGEGETVVISAKCHPNAVSVTVTDRGIGMSPEAISKATQAFSRFSHAHIASGDSMGLGLSIASKLCKLLGATLDIQSREGAGTTVRIDFPGTPVKSETQEALALAG